MIDTLDRYAVEISEFFEGEGLPILGQTTYHVLYQPSFHAEFMVSFSGDQRQVVVRAATKSLWYRLTAAHERHPAYPPVPTTALVVGRVSLESDDLVKPIAQATKLLVGPHTEGAFGIDGMSVQLWSTSDGMSSIRLTGWHEGPVAMLAEDIYCMIMDRASPEGSAGPYLVGAINYVERCATLSPGWAQVQAPEDAVPKSTYLRIGEIRRPL